MGGGGGGGGVGEGGDGDGSGMENIQPLIMKELLSLQHQAWNTVTA